MTALEKPVSNNAQTRTADATPHAAALIESLRDIGYSLESALADIIDNAITAKAASIKLMSETATDDPHIGIIDDGLGMSEAELIEAMRPGSRNPLEKRGTIDLGRFGLGLKSASFSQCRRLTVVSRRNGHTTGAVWDLDRVAETNEWRIELLDDMEKLPFIEFLSGDHGTLVLWQKADRLAGSIRRETARRAEHINRNLAEAERHICLVFQRFMENSQRPLKIFLNGRALAPLDPFASSHPSCQADPEEELHLADGIVKIQSFTLPHHKSMTRAEWEEIGGLEGHLKSQGFWVYRAQRLIIAGSWLGLARQSELSKLCRIRVDIPNTMDPIWKIDVKKSSAQLPPAVRERLTKVVERFASTSKRTYRKRGQKLVDEARMPLWNRNQKDGRIIYVPNIDHPVLTNFAKCLDEDLQRQFENCVRLLGSGLPVESLQVDIMGNAEALRADQADIDAIRQGLDAVIPSLLNAGTAPSTIRRMLRDTEPYRSSWDQTKVMIDELLPEEKNHEFPTRET